MPQPSGVAEMMAKPGRRRRGRPGYDLASVLAVAVELFNERGYDGTSMRDLAARLGIAKNCSAWPWTGPWPACRR